MMAKTQNTWQHIIILHSTPLRHLIPHTAQVHISKQAGLCHYGKHINLPMTYQTSETTLDQIS